MTKLYILKNIFGIRLKNWAENLSTYEEVFWLNSILSQAQHTVLQVLDIPSIKS